MDLCFPLFCAILLLIWLSIWFLPAKRLYHGGWSQVFQTSRHYGPRGEFLGTTVVPTGEQEWNAPNPTAAVVWLVLFPIVTVAWGLWSGCTPVHLYLGHLQAKEQGARHTANVKATKELEAKLLDKTMNEVEQIYGVPSRKEAGEWCYDTRNVRISFGGHGKVVFINVLDNKNDVIP